MFQLPDETHIGHVHLQVKDLGRALDFYHGLLGFREVDRREGTVYLSATGDAPHHFLLSELPGARPKPPRTTGLYHVAVRFASRQALARAFRRLVKNQWPFQGFSDHKVSEALYLADPDDNGLELYVDRPRESWPERDGQIEMGTDPLDVEALLAEAEDDRRPWTGVDSATEIGHVHLHVSDLARAEAFYADLLGFDVTQRSYPGALFLSAGGYHHHVGVNVWAGRGAPPPPPDAVGLRAFALNVPDQATQQALLARMEAAGIQVEEEPDYGYAEGVLIRDPDGNGVEVLRPLPSLEEDTA